MKLFESWLLVLWWIVDPSLEGEKVAAGRGVRLSGILLSHIYRSVGSPFEISRAAAVKTSNSRRSLGFDRPFTI